MDDLRARLTRLVAEADEGELVAIHDTLIGYCELLEAPQYRRQLRHATGKRDHPDALFLRRYLLAEAVG